MQKLQKSSKREKEDDDNVGGGGVGGGGGSACADADADPSNNLCEQSVYHAISAADTAKIVQLSKSNKIAVHSLLSTVLFFAHRLYLTRNEERKKRAMAVCKQNRCVCVCMCVCVCVCLMLGKLCHKLLTTRIFQNFVPPHHDC